ncbi:MAG: prepilin-type N-terminal cleavage/methylation domain-containing protein [Deltaproteobacteria bacterium]|nr:MAG: prepilin-type N-terminal cleavage/methylation domain-containing protein [Deltaproteobacteria bacterium]
MSRRSGFTLIEVLAVVLITSLLLGATISFYLNLTRQAARASENTREARRAAALIDRVATDLESALLVKKPKEQDALAQPWLFVGESRYSATGPQAGSDQLKFIRRDDPRASDGPASNVEMVAYTLHRSERASDHFELRRWSSPELPERLDLDFPRSDDPASLLVADDLSYFAVRFLDDTGQWHDRWDSTQLVESSQLPRAVEIQVALAPPETASDEEIAEAEPVPYARLVELPMRPLDLEQLLNPKEKDGKGGKGENEGEDGKQRTIGECVDVSKLGISAPGFSESDLATLAAAVNNNAALPFTKAMAEQFAGLAAINPDCL